MRGRDESADDSIDDPQSRGNSEAGEWQNRLWFGTEGGGEFVGLQVKLRIPMILQHRLFRQAIGQTQFFPLTGGINGNNPAGWLDYPRCYCQACGHGIVAGYSSSAQSSPSSQSGYCCGFSPSPPTTRGYFTSSTANCSLRLVFLILKRQSSPKSNR